ncbi:MAG TPA: polysaccharide biosynthesis tyrosine autokinase [Solirubrobacteraceae bacterium]|jgi:succinoglycan biosynthesis transport protein ExoP|nr:polysaccharide biosynthesis tyrosine autokinase [Solirubrobacteraceae bacterium]
MELQDFLTLIWKRRLVVGVVFACCVIVAGAYAATRTKLYESTATIAFTPNPKQGDFLPSENLNALLSTYAAVAKSDQNLGAAAQLLGHKVSGTVSTSTGNGSGILEIIVEATSPHGAAEDTGAVTRAFVHSVEGNGLLVPSVVNPPSESNTALQPRPPLIISLAAVLGLIVGIMVALGLDKFRPTVEDPAEFTELTGLPVIGRFQRERKLADGSTRLVWDSTQLAASQEAYRNLRANVELLIEDQPTVIQVTSANAGEGKSTMVANLAVALGQLDIPTTVIDADMRHPRQHKLFQVSNEVGLSTAMLLPEGDISPQSTAFKDVSVLTSGPTTGNAAEMLHVRFRSILSQLRAKGGVILVDSPPTLPVSDAPLIARQVDAVLFVIASGRTRRSAIGNAVDKLRFAQANIIGLVLNFAERDSEADSSYYSYSSDAGVQRPDSISMR